MRISDWSSDVCSSDLNPLATRQPVIDAGVGPAVRAGDRHGDRVVARPVAQARIAAARDIAIANQVLDRRISGWSPAARPGREVLTSRIARAVAHRLQNAMFIQEIVTPERKCVV